MAGHYINTVEDERTGRPVSGATIKVYQDGATISGKSVTSGTLATIYSDDGVTTIDQTNDPVTSASDGKFDFYTDDTRVIIAVLFNGVGVEVWNDVDIIGGTVSSDVTTLAGRVDNHDTLFGTSANATDLGTFTYDVIADSETVKGALQDLEDSLKNAAPLFLDIANDLIGVGTSSPARPLDVVSDSGAIGVQIRNRAADDVGALQFTQNDGSTSLALIQGRSTDFRIASANANPITFRVNSVEHMSLDNNGDLNVSGAVNAGGVNVLTESIVLACSDESNVIDTTGTKLTFRMPFAMTLTGVRASLVSACSTGTFTVDINEGGSTVLSTKLTIDATEKTSTTAAAAAVISDSALADDAEITIDVDDVGDSTATGLKVTLIGTRS